MEFRPSEQDHSEFGNAWGPVGLLVAFYLWYAIALRTAATSKATRRHHPPEASRSLLNRFGGACFLVHFIRNVLAHSWSECVAPGNNNFKIESHIPMLLLTSNSCNRSEPQFHARSFFGLLQYYALAFPLSARAYPMAKLLCWGPDSHHDRVLVIQSTP